MLASPSLGLCKLPSRYIEELCVPLAEFPCLELWNAAIFYCVFGLLRYPGLGVAAELFWPL